MTEFLTDTADVMDVTFAADAMGGMVPDASAVRYAAVPCRFEDLGQQQVLQLLQMQIDARHRIICQLPGAVNENKSAVRFADRLYRVTGTQARRANAFFDAFDVLYLQAWVPV